MAQSHAWVTQFDDTRQTSSGGPLSGLTFAVKDMYAEKGHTNAAGNPTWLQHSSAAREHAPCVRALCDAGARLRGITHMDELAYSLNGENVHYGTPVNAAAPDRIPGGSSSGSASAVAWGEVDFAIGSDTAGSVRIPASYQGLFGFRPTHGVISMEGAIPLAPGYDTVGWFASTAQLLARVGTTLLSDSQAAPAHEELKAWAQHSRLHCWKVGTDVLATAPDVAQAIYEAMSQDFGAVQGVLGPPEEVKVAQEGTSLDDWLAIWKAVQGAEVWETHGKWIQQRKPVFGKDTQARFDAAAQLPAEDVARRKAEQAEMVKHMHALLGNDSFLTVPSAPGPAPLKNLPSEELNTFRAKALTITCVAGLCGLPQVSIPCAQVDGLPVGLGIIGPRNSDLALLQLASDLAEALPLVQPDQLGAKKG